MTTAPHPIDHLGELLHERYVEHEVAAGQTPADNPSLVPFAQLPVHLQQSNRDTAGQIWDRLELCGYGVVPKSDAGIAIPESDLLTHVEVLAELGHSRWMQNRIAQGWTFGPGPKDIAARTSPSLVPWADLPEDDRERERRQIRDLPGLLGMVDLKIIRCRALHVGWRAYEVDHVAEPFGPVPAALAPPVPFGVNIAGPTPTMLEELGRELHENYVRHRVEAGDRLEDNPALFPWEQLAPAYQQSNRQTAAEIWHRLGTIGFGVAPLDSDLPRLTPAEFARHEEALSKLGHIAWLNERLAAQWTYAPGAKDVDARTHPCLVPWEDLPEVEREKERQQIRDIPGILATVDLRIVRLPAHYESGLREARGTDLTVSGPELGVGREPSSSSNWTAERCSVPPGGTDLTVSGPGMEVRLT